MSELKIRSVSGVSVSFKARGNNTILSLLDNVSCLYAAGVSPLMLSVVMDNGLSVWAEYVNTGYMYIKAHETGSDESLANTNVSGVHRLSVGRVLSDICSGLSDDGTLPELGRLDGYKFRSYRVRYDLGCALFFVGCQHPRDILCYMDKVESDDGRKVSIMVKSNTSTEYINYYTDTQMVSKNFYDVIT